jgi:hypothetical protein
MRANIGAGDFTALPGASRGQGTRVIALHAAFIDTDMARNIPGPKVAPQEVARQLLEAIAGDAQEVLADQTMRQVQRGLGAQPAVYLQQP